jgi:hypothetical protein
MRSGFETCRLATEMQEHGKVKYLIMSKGGDRSKKKSFGMTSHESVLLTGNGEAEGGVIPQLSRNCDGNESRDCHCPALAGREGR